MKIRLLGSALIASTLLLAAGCSSSDSDETPKPDSQDTEVADPLGHISSCDQVATIVKPYISALVLTDSSTVDEWGVNCQWETAEGETDMANNRSVGVRAAINEPGTPEPDLSGVLKMDGTDQLEDSWLGTNDGVAYTLTTKIAVAAATVTTVWLPDVEVTVDGGTWGKYPALDGPAALKVVQTLLAK